MLNKVLTIFQFLIIISFLLLTNFYYFSDKNVEKINKNKLKVCIVKNSRIEIFYLEAFKLVA